ncbi:hypothetical protein GB937_005499 [Aspergillus fischeri]|nr:hypothetical protein GB937_005499 [Aspergillus fischeri]
MAMMEKGENKLPVSFTHIGQDILGPLCAADMLLSGQVDICVTLANYRMDKYTQREKVEQHKPTACHITILKPA